MILQILILILLIAGCFYDLKTRMVPRYYITLPIVLLSIPLIRFELASLLISAFLTTFLIAAYKLRKMGLADLIVLIPLILIVNNALIFWIFYNITGLITIIMLIKPNNAKQLEYRYGSQIYHIPKNIRAFGVCFLYNTNIPAFVPITIAYVVTMW